MATGYTGRRTVALPSTWSRRRRMEGTTIYDVGSNSCQAWGTEL